MVKEQKEQVLGRPVGTHGMPAAAIVLWVHEDMELGKEAWARLFVERIRQR